MFVLVWSSDVRGHYQVLELGISVIQVEFMLLHWWLLKGYNFSFIFDYMVLMYVV